MKIVCDNCATKYSIADEKVRGKVFKIRCKKCSHIIVVRGNENGEPVQAGADADEAAPAVSSSPTPAPASGDSVWHLVVSGEQVGPMSPAEIRAKFAAGEVDAETYAWKEGFGDWLRLASIDDFKDLAAPAAPEEGQTRRTDAADLFARAAADEGSNQDAGSDLFGSTPAAASAAAKPAASDVFAPASSNLFGSAAQSASASDAVPTPQRQARASTPAVAAAPAGNAGGGEGMSSSESKMAGQRNENSVLFSLNNLQALASSNGAPSKQGGPAPAAKAGVDSRPGFANSQSEGSGLIDIRAMAASTLAAAPSASSNSSRPDDLPPLSAPPIFSPMAAPIMMAAPSQGMPKWMYAVLGIGGLLVTCFAVIITIILTKKDPAPIVAVTNPTTPTTQPLVAGTTPTAVPAGDPKAAVPAADAPKAEAKNDAKADAPATGDETKTKKVSSSSKPHADKKPGKEAVAQAAPEVAAPPPKPTKPKKGGDDLDDLLNQASPGSKKSAPVAKEAPSNEDLPDQLDKGAIVGGMKRVSGKVADCYNQFKVPGMANVSVTIGKSGSVSNASVGGAFSGTPTGSCVERAVKGASFPKFKGASQSITYPFILR